VDEGPFGSTITRAIKNVDRFVLVTLDIPNEVRDSVDSHFYYRILERVFAGEAHLGILVALYRKKISLSTGLEFRFQRMINKSKKGDDS
jgi:hypothetical protein